MSDIFWWLAAFVLIIVWTRIWLRVTNQRIYYHDQNLTDGKGPMWRHGRCWWRITSVDEKRFDGPGARAEWSVSRHETFALTVTVLGDEDEDIQFHVGIPYLVSVWFTLERLPLLRKIPYKWRRTWGYLTGVKFHGGSLWIHILHSEMWGTKHGTFRRFLPRWISIAVSSGYAEWRGVGFYICFDFDHLIFGSYERTEQNLGDPIVAEIPIEPDNSLGFRYFATFQRQQEVRWRGNFPWRKKRDTYWEISTDKPPMRAGKGENSYDQDDDGIFGCAVHGETIQEAIAEYVKKCERDRERYGMPGVIIAAFWAKEDQLIEENIRAAFRGEFKQAACTNFHQGPFVRMPDGRSQCVTCQGIL